MLIEFYTNSCVYLCIYDVINILLPCYASMESVGMHVVEGIFVKRNVRHVILRYEGKIVRTCSTPCRQRETRRGSLEGVGLDGPITLKCALKE
jgi:hypothetical protein